MEFGIALRENDKSRLTLDRGASLQVVDHTSRYQWASKFFVTIHFWLLLFWFYAKNACISAANRFPFLWEILFIKKLFNFQWTVYRSDSYAIKWSVLSFVIDLFWMATVILVIAYIIFVLFSEFNGGSTLSFTDVTPYLSLIFYLLTFLGLCYKLLKGENEALQKEIADKYKIKLVIPYWFWGAESTYSFDDFMEMVIFKSTDGYYITGENCFIFDERTLGNPVFTNELSLLCAKHRKINVLHFNAGDKTLTAVPVCYFFSKAPNAQAVTAPVYGKIMKKLSNSNFYWMFVYVVLSVAFLVCIGTTIKQMTVDVPCYSCCHRHHYGSYCFDDQNQSQCGDVCQDATISVTKSGDQPYAALQSIIVLMVLLLVFMTYMILYIVYFIDQLFITTAVRIDSEHFRDSNYQIMEKLKSKTCYKVLQEAFSEQMGDFDFDATYFSVLNSTRYYLTESVGIPVSMFRIFLNVFAIKQDRKISLRLKISEGQCILDSEFNPYVPTGKSSVVIYYSRMGNVWLATQSDRDDTVNLSAEVLREVLLRH